MIQMLIRYSQIQQTLDTAAAKKSYRVLLNVMGFNTCLSQLTQIP